MVDQNTKNITLGYDDVKNKTEIYEDLEESLKNFSKLHKGPILIAHSDIKTTQVYLHIVEKLRDENMAKLKSLMPHE